MDADHLLLTIAPECGTAEARSAYDAWLRKKLRHSAHEWDPVDPHWNVIRGGLHPEESDSDGSGLEFIDARNPGPEREIRPQSLRTPRSVRHPEEGVDPQGAANETAAGVAGPSSAGAESGPSGSGARRSGAAEEPPSTPVGQGPRYSGDLTSPTLGLRGVMLPGTPGRTIRQDAAGVLRTPTRKRSRVQVFGTGSPRTATETRDRNRQAVASGSGAGSGPSQTIPSVRSQTQTGGVSQTLSSGVAGGVRVPPSPFPEQPVLLRGPTAPRSTRSAVPALLMEHMEAFSDLEPSNPQEARRRTVAIQHFFREVLPELNNRYNRSVRVAEPGGVAEGLQHYLYGFSASSTNLTDGSAVRGTGTWPEHGAVLQRTEYNRLLQAHEDLEMMRQQFVEYGGTPPEGNEVRATGIRIQEPQSSGGERRRLRGVAAQSSAIRTDAGASGEQIVRPNPQARLVVQSGEQAEDVEEGSAADENEERAASAEAGPAAEPEGA